MHRQELRFLRPQCQECRHVLDEADAAADVNDQLGVEVAELGLATEVEYGPGYPFGPRPVAIAVGAGIRPVVR